MRECASVAEQFAQIVGNFSFNGNPPPFPALANGQYPMPIPPSLPAAEETGKKRKSRGGDDADGKRKKKLKDPNAPKRPPSSYLLFQNDVRNELKAKNPGMPNNELLGVISKLWAEMPQEQKDVCPLCCRYMRRLTPCLKAYEARNRAAKEEWLSKKAVYESGKGVIAPPVPVSCCSAGSEGPRTHLVRPERPPSCCRCPNCCQASRRSRRPRRRDIIVRGIHCRGR